MPDNERTFVTASLQQWFNSGELPADYYQLLGTKLLHPSRDELLQKIRESHRYLHPIANHSEPGKAQVARQLQALLGKAEQAFSTAENCQKYEAAIIAELKREYAGVLQSPGASRRIDQASRWLRFQRNVHPHRAQGVAETIAGADDGAGIGLTEQEELLSRRKKMFPAQSPQSGTRPPGRSTKGSASSAPTVQPSVAAPKKAQPPRPPSTVQPIRVPGGSGQPRSAQAGESSGASAVLWIIGSAVLTAVLLVGIVLIFFPDLISQSPQQTASSSVDESEYPDFEDSDETTTNQAGDPPEAPIAGEAAPSQTDQPSPPTGDSTDVEDPQERQTPEEDNSPDGEAVADAPSEPEMDKPETDEPAQAAEESNGKLVVAHPDGIAAMAWQPDGKRIATAGDDGKVRLWNTANGQQELQLSVTNQFVLALAWNAGGELLAVGTDDGHVGVWKSGSNDTGISVAGDDVASEVTSLGWLNKSSKLAVGDDDGNVSVRNPKSGRTSKEVELSGTAGDVKSIRTFRGSSPSTAALYRDDTIVVWDLERETSLRHFLKMDGDIWDEIVATDATPDAFTRSLPACHAHPSCADIAWSADGKFLAVATEDVDIWNLSNDKATIRDHILPGLAEYVSVAWSPSGQLLAAADSDNRITVWETDAWRAVWSNECPAAILSLDWDPADSNRIAAACNNSEFHIFGLEPDVAEQRLAPPFNVADLLEAAEEQDALATRLIINLLEMYRITRVDRDKVKELELQVKQEAGDLLELIDAEPLEDGQQLMDRWLELQEIIDIHTDDASVKEARRRMERIKITRRPSDARRAKTKGSRTKQDDRDRRGGQSGARRD